MNTLPDLPTQQALVLELLIDYQREHGYSPSIPELGKLHGTTSTATVAYHLKALEKKGYIRRQKGKQRAMQILHDPRTDEGPATPSVDGPYVNMSRCGGLEITISHEWFHKYLIDKVSVDCNLGAAWALAAGIQPKLQAEIGQLFTTWLRRVKVEEILDQAKKESIWPVTY